MPRFVRFALKQSSKSNENNEHHHRRCLICILGIQQICFQLDPFFSLSIHIIYWKRRKRPKIECVDSHYPLDGSVSFYLLSFLLFIYLLTHYVHVPDDQKLMFSGRNKKKKNLMWIDYSIVAPCFVLSLHCHRQEARNQRWRTLLAMLLKKNGKELKESRCM